MSALTRGQIEAAFTKAIVQFEKEYLGRGPKDARTYIFQDLVLVRLRGILTPAEEKLSETREGRALVKDTRRQLFETSRPLLAELVQEILDATMISLHTDMSSRTGERIIVITLDQDLEPRWR